MTLKTQERILKIKKARLKLAERIADVARSRNLTDAPVGQGSKTAEIYCGDEYYAEFLIRALGELGIKAETEIYTVDGEYHVEVKL